MVTLEQLRNWALSYPEATEELHVEKPSFRIKKKIFATYDSLTQRACVKLSLVDQDLFSLTDKTIIYPVQNAWGKQGWTYIELKKVTGKLFKEVLTAAYCEVAPKKLSARFRPATDKD